MATLIDPALYDSGESVGHAAGQVTPPVEHRVHLIHQTGLLAVRTGLLLEPAPCGHDAAGYCLEPGHRH